MNTPILFNVKYRAWYRKYGTDIDRFNEVKRCYRHMLILPEDTVLDIGGNIGLFTLMYGRFGNKVYVYEPEDINFEILNKNLFCYSHVKCYKKAVIKEDKNKTFFYLAQGKSSGIHSCKITRGRVRIKVPSIAFKKVLALHKPDVIKMDIEGMEYDLLSEELSKCVREICIEFHFGQKAMKKNFFPTLNFLFNQGFKEVNPVSKEIKSKWATIIHLRRQNEYTRFFKT